jgi:hypothetical protein
MVLIVIIVIVAGCLDSDRTYKNTTDPNNTITLKSNGGFEWKDDGYVWVGKYEETEDHVVLVLSPPFPSIQFQKDGNKIFYVKKPNAIWVKA